MRGGEILDKLAELHLAVRLPRNINHVNDFVATYKGGKCCLVRVTSDGGVLEADARQ